MVKNKKVLLATGWLKPNGIFEEVPRREQETWAARHLITELKDFTYYGKEVEEQLQRKYNYMKFEDGVLMTAVWRSMGMYFKYEQTIWIQENWDLLTKPTQDFCEEFGDFKWRD